MFAQLQAIEIDSHASHVRPFVISISTRTHCNNYFIWLCQINQCKANRFLIIIESRNEQKHECLLSVRYYLCKQNNVCTMGLYMDPSFEFHCSWKWMFQPTIQCLHSSHTHSILTPQKNGIFVCDCLVIMSYHDSKHWLFPINKQRRRVVWWTNFVECNTLIYNPFHVTLNDLNVSNRLNDVLPSAITDQITFYEI